MEHTSIEDSSACFLDTVDIDFPYPTAHTLQLRALKQH